MKVRKLLELQALIEERKIPCDMTDDFKYWSKSKNDWVSILDMDLIHVVRALNIDSSLEFVKYKDTIQTIKDFIETLEDK